MKKCYLCDNHATKKLCFACYREVARIKTKQKLVAYKGGKCEICGYNKCLRSLTFHHIDPSKKDFIISAGYGNSFEKLIKEVDKCQLLCHNCHNEVHEKESLKKNLTLKRYEYATKKSSEEIIQTRKCAICQKNFTPNENRRKHCSMNCFLQRSRIPTKQILEELIWKKPTTHIAKDFGVSDKAVDKWCKKYDLEKPPRGYWAKLNKGTTHVENN